MNDLIVMSYQKFGFLTTENIDKQRNQQRLRVVQVSFASAMVSARIKSIGDTFWKNCKFGVSSITIDKSSNLQESPRNVSTIAHGLYVM